MNGVHYRLRLRRTINDLDVACKKLACYTGLRHKDHPFHIMSAQNDLLQAISSWQYYFERWLTASEKLSQRTAEKRYTVHRSNGI